jgi:cytochrome P450
LTIL